MDSLFVPRSGEGHLTFTRPVHGKPSLAGVFSAALCQSGPGGAGAGLQADCRLDKHQSIPDPHYYRGRRRNPCQGASFCVWTPSSVKLSLTLLLCFISARLLSVLMLLSFFRKHTQSSTMSLQPSPTSWPRRPISARSAIICLHPYAFSNRPVTWWTKIWMFPVLQRFYESGCCTEPTDTERSHVSRFHTRPAAGMTSPALSTRKHATAPDNKVTIICCFFSNYVSKTLFKNLFWLAKSREILF